MYSSFVQKDNKKVGKGDPQISCTRNEPAHVAAHASRLDLAVQAYQSEIETILASSVDSPVICFRQRKHLRISTG